MNTTEPGTSGGDKQLRVLERRYRCGKQRWSSEDNGAPDGKTLALKWKQPTQYQHRKNSLNCNQN